MVLGPVLLPRLLDSAERISPEVQQEDLSLGPHSALSSAGIWNPGLLGPLFLVYLCPYALLWGPWPLACVSISLPSRVQRQIWVGQLLPWHRWDLAPYSHQRLVLILRAQRKLCVQSHGAACPQPAGGVRSSMGNQTVQGRGVWAGQGRRSKRCHHFHTRQGLCAVFAFRAGKSMSDGGSEVANLVGQPTRAVLP